MADLALRSDVLAGPIVLSAGGRTASKYGEGTVHHASGAPPAVLALVENKTKKKMERTWYDVDAVRPPAVRM